MCRDCVEISTGRGAERIRTGGSSGTVEQENYSSGDDYVVRFLGYELFNSCRLEERVVAAAVRLGLIPDNALDDDETG